MVNKPTNKISRDELAKIWETIEKMSSENQFLRQRVELEHDWREERYKQSQEFAQHKRDVAREITKRLGGLSLVGLIVIGLGWWSVTRPIRRSVQVRLDKEFASKNIKMLISNAALRAAQSQTKQMIETTLKPAVNQAIGQIQQQRSAVMQFTGKFRQESRKSMGRIQSEIGNDRQHEEEALHSLRNEYTREIGQLRPLVEFQDKLEKIEILKGDGINGDFGAYEKLATYKTSDKNLANAAQSAVIEIKEPYLVGTRTQGVSIWEVNPNGTKGPTNEQMSSSALVNVLLSKEKPWEHRTKAAELLASKHEMGVAEALLTAMQTDQNLWVRRAALLSFQSLTGFQAKDVFDFGGAAQWWTKNKASYLKKIAK